MSTSISSLVIILRQKSEYRFFIATMLFYIL